MTDRTHETFSVTLIDDDEDQLVLISAALRNADSGMYLDQPFQVQTHTDPTDAIANLPAEGATCIICDNRMPGGDGVEWLPDLIRLGRGPVILISGQGDEHIATEAFKAGASDYLVKDDILETPWLLHRSIHDALRRYRLEQRNRQLARELKIANMELEQKIQALSEMTETAHRFVDNVAHEFRTPLTVIREFASIIHDGIGGPVTEKQVEFLDYIDAATRDMAQMVDDFLDSSKLREGKLRVDRRPTRVADIFASVMPMIEARAKAKHVHVETTLEENLPHVFCDAEKARRVLINLVTNAIKFSPQGDRVTIEAGHSESGFVSIDVIDHGPGMDTKQLSVVCERFEQAGRQTWGGEKGFGLGLNIARDLVHLNLGQMKIHSRVGEGSTFTFTLPVWEPMHVIQQYAEAITDARGPRQITLLGVGLNGSGATYEDMHAHLVAHCHSMDLAVPAMDHQSIVLIGADREPDGWVQDIQDTWARRMDSQGHSIRSGSLDVRWIGTWAYPRMKHAVMAAASDRVLGVRACA